jgi:hypothetical protein
MLGGNVSNGMSKKRLCSSRKRWSGSHSWNVCHTDEQKTELNLILDTHTFTQKKHKLYVHIQFTTKAKNYLRKMMKEVIREARGENTTFTCFVCEIQVTDKYYWQQLNLYEHFSKRNAKTKKYFPLQINIFHNG